MENAVQRHVATAVISSLCEVVATERHEGGLVH